MSITYHTINWQEQANDFTIDCSLDIAVHPASSSTLLLIVPGVDGSLDGYENKYVTIAENVQSTHNVAVVRMANPFISSAHWESNLRETLGYIHDNAQAIAGNNDTEIRIMAHSAGAAIASHIAWEYPTISRLLLINPATKLGLDKIKHGLSKHGPAKTTILFGSNDPNIEASSELAKLGVSISVIEGADHHFSGDNLEHFINAPHHYLFD